MNLDFLTEAKVISITTFSSQNNLALVIIDVHGKEWLVQADQVDDFLVNEMRMHNIIDEVTFIESAKPLSETMKKNIYSLMRNQDLINIDFEWSPFKDKIRSIESGALSLLEIVPVYGAYILLLAKHISIREVRSLERTV